MRSEIADTNGIALVARVTQAEACVYRLRWGAVGRTTAPAKAERLPTSVGAVCAAWLGRSLALPLGVRVGAAWLGGSLSNPCQCMERLPSYFISSNSRAWRRLASLS